MTSLSQANRPIQVTTPLGQNVLLATGFRGYEELSALFSFELDLIAENSTQIDFSKLVGSELTLKVVTPGDGGEPQWRYLSGICACFSQGDRNERFTAFSAEIVPRLWLLTRQAQSRIFQQRSVPDILKSVFEGLECDYQLHGRYEPREYCVQYQESDFDFASRLMEEEGIYYFFKHNESGHKLTVADTAQSHLDVPGLTKARYGMIEGGPRKADHIFKWRKTQTIRSAKYSVWDHSFQQPKQNLEAKANIMPSVQAGSVEHKLNGQVNAALEIYEFPGGYAVRFDGVNPSGGEQADRLQKLFADNERVAKLRMQAEAAESLRIVGSSSCSNFTTGHKFTLERHFDADGDYALVSVTHEASLGDAYTSGSGAPNLTYSNSFTCIPLQLPFRPKRKTPKPFVQGVQHALVTGPAGEEIFTDKYGRVKVQFYWDRQGKKDANSSCWLRVGQAWAGKNWGSVQIPRIGQEVIVAFVEGNPDEPLIVGSVYNPDTMPPYELPGKKVVCGLKSNTHKGKGYNEMSMDDTAGKEKVTIHSQYDMGTTVEHDQTDTVHNNRTITIDGTHTETIKKDTTIKITEGKLDHDVVAGTAKYHVQGAVSEDFDDKQETVVNKDIIIVSESTKIHVTAATEIQLQVGASTLLMKSDGSIKLTGTNIAIDGAQKVAIHGGEVESKADGSHTTAGVIVMSDGSGTNTVKGGMVMLNP